MAACGQRSPTVSMITTQELLYFDPSGQRAWLVKQSLHCPSVFKTQQDETLSTFKGNCKLSLFGLTTGISWQKCKKKKMFTDKTNVCKKGASQSRDKLFLAAT